MTDARATMERATLAGLFLSAAAFFVVGPAEASRTTTDTRSHLAPTSAEALLLPSRELASLKLPRLELPPLEPIEPTDSAAIAPRLGFAEDLGLLDIDLRPCGFELFGGVGTSRCALTYARNNPLKYVDPDGKQPTWAQDASEALTPGLQAVAAATEIAAQLGADPTGLLSGGANLALLGARTLNIGTATGEAYGAGGDSFDVAIAASGDAQTFFTASATIAGFGAAAGSPFGGGPKIGSFGGPGSRARFSNATRAAVNAESGRKCVFCGVETTKARGPLQANTDHAIAKARGGNNSRANAQNTCRTCNLQKKTDSSVVFTFKKILDFLF